MSNLPASMTPEVARWFMEHTHSVAYSDNDTPDKMLDFKNHFQLKESDYQSLKALAAQENTDQQVKRDKEAK